jgi:hypothetical protein
VGPLTDVVGGGEADAQLVEEVDVQQDWCLLSRGGAGDLSNVPG